MRFLAAVLAICSAFLFLPASDAGVNLGLDARSDASLNMVIAVLALLGSAVLFIRSGPPLRPLLRRGARFACPQATESPASIGVVRQSQRRGSGPPPMRSLAWQTLREVRPIVGWLVLLAIGGALARLSRMEAESGTGLVGMRTCRGDSCGYQRVRHRESRAEPRPSSRIMERGPDLVWLVKVGIWVAALASDRVPF